MSPTFQRLACLGSPLKNCLKKLRSQMLIIVAALAVAGCGGDEEEKPDPPPPPKPPAEKPAPKPEPEVKPDKSIKPIKAEDPLEKHLKLTLNEPLELAEFQATLNLGVLQLSSYEDDVPSTYPAVYIRSKVVGDTPKSLEGKTFSVNVYVQLEKEKPPVHTTDGNPLQLKITKVSDTVIAGELLEGTFTDAGTGEQVPIKGTFGAEIK